MHRHNRTWLTTVLTAVVVVETIFLIDASLRVTRTQQRSNTVHDIARFYADILERNEVPLTDYDLIALNTLISREKVLHVGFEDD